MICTSFLSDIRLTNSKFEFIIYPNDVSKWANTLHCGSILKIFSSFLSYNLSNMTWLTVVISRAWGYGLLDDLLDITQCIFFCFFRSLKPICVITATTQPPRGIYCRGIWNLTLRNDPTNVQFVKGVSKLWPHYKIMSIHTQVTLLNLGHFWVLLDN